MVGSKFSVRFAALFLVSLVLVACPSDSPELFGLKILEKTLSNGLKIVVIQNRTAPVVSYQTWFHVGSGFEQPGQAGISNLLEHLYAKRENQLESLGVQSGSTLARDFTFFHVQGLPEFFSQIVNVESTRMRGLEFSTQALDAEKWVIFEERALRLATSPEIQVQEALWAHAFEAHPYSWPVTGIPEEIAALTPEQVQAFFDRFYVASNAVVVVVGPMDPQIAMNQLEIAYTALPERPKPKLNLYVEPEQKEERRRKISGGNASTQTTRVGIAYPIVSAFDQDAYALDVLAQVLFDSDLSRAEKILVHENPIAIAVSGGAYTPEQPGLFLITALLREGTRTADFESRVDHLFEEVAENGVTEQELQSSVKLLTLQLLESARTPFGLSQFVGTVQTFFGKTQRFAQDLEKYASVTQSDLKKVARKYFGLNRRTVVTLGAERSK